MRALRSLLNWWPTFGGILLGLYLAGVIGCTVIRQPVTLNVFQAATNDGDEQMGDCLLWNDAEMVCDMGIRI